jgi:antirestriction protein ArdC
MSKEYASCHRSIFTGPSPTRSSPSWNRELSPGVRRSKAGHPRNLNTGKPYHGVNVFLLAFVAHTKGYGSSYWLTFNQAKERGGNIRKGEKSTIVIFWKQHQTKDKQTGAPIKIPALRYYNVWNAEQVDGIEIPDTVTWQPIDFHPIEEAEKIAAGYAGGPTVLYDGGQQAFYRPATDTIHMPERTRFASVEEFYSTLFHESSHSVGHSSRLDRKLDTDPKPFGSPDYGKEELIAEMSAAFLCSIAGIQPAVIGNQAAYLAGWLKQIKSDKKLVISAAGQAQRSADWIRGERGQTD